jgi:hypothetical protein
MLSKNDGVDGKSEATGALRTVLEDIGARSLADLAAKPTSEVIAHLDTLPVPSSEALLGAVVLHAVDDLRNATKRLDAGTDRLLTLTRALVVLATLTLAAAIATLVASR